MKPFRLVETGGPYGDCTCSYDVIFRSPMTLGEFIAALPHDEREWGAVRLANVFGEKIGEYKQKTMLITDPIFYFSNIDRIVIDAKAHGGWSLMDYSIELAPDPEVTKNLTVDLHAHTNFEF